MEDKNLYKYTCTECFAEYISDDSELKYCNSEKCMDKDNVLNGPYLFED
jgi:hypothetical protein